MPMSEHTVGEVAKLAHVSVRTLHHYDGLGLLTPSGRSAAGYRLYSEADLRRLAQILFYRELEFPLDEIAEILADPSTGTDDHLRRQHRLVRERQARNAGLLAAIEKEMEARRMGISLTPEEQFEIFGTTKMDEYTEEAQERWGETDAWKESARRTATYTKEDWVAIKAEADANIAGFAVALTAGEPADGPVATALAEEHRAHLGPLVLRLLRTRCTAESRTCTSPTRATWRPTTRSRRASRSTCTTRSTQTPSSKPD